MAGFKIPIFESGTVLTQEMLETMKMYAIDLGTLEYAGYADGIISGCEVTMTGNLLYVSRGIVVYAGNLYFLPKEMKVVINPGNDWQILRLQIGSMSREKNFMIGELQLELTSEITGAPNKIEICRFRLQSGAILRNQYRDFQDLNTEFDTINEIYAQWSGYQTQSISSRVLIEFVKEARKKNLQNQLDIMFIQQIMSLNGKAMNRDAILFYISSRMGKPYKEMNNMEIYKALSEILRTSGNGVGGHAMHQRMERRIIVD